MNIKNRLIKLETQTKANESVLVLPLYPGNDEKKLITDWEAENGKPRPDLVVFIRKFSQHCHGIST
jgi:hypothetical protein